MLKVFLFCATYGERLAQGIQFKSKVANPHNLWAGTVEKQKVFHLP